MCAIERHPDSSTRDSLTHTLFNLIKRPDEQQRRIIMDVGHCLKNEICVVSQIYSYKHFFFNSFQLYFRHVLALLRMLER